MLDELSAEDVKLLDLPGGEPDVGIRMRAERKDGVEVRLDAYTIEPSGRPRLL